MYCRNKVRRQMSFYSLRSTGEMRESSEPQKRSKTSPITQNALQYNILQGEIHIKNHERYTDLSCATIFFHPDFTVGPGISPDPAFRLAGFTAGRELHPALKIIKYYLFADRIIRRQSGDVNKFSDKSVQYSLPENHRTGFSAAGTS